MIHEIHNDIYVMNINISWRIRVPNIFGFPSPVEGQNELEEGNSKQDKVAPS